MIAAITHNGTIRGLIFAIVRFSISIVFSPERGVSGGRRWFQVERDIPFPVETLLAANAR